MADELIGGLLGGIITNGSQTNQLLGKLIEVLGDVLPFGGAFGSFTCAAASSTTVTNASVQTNSRILLMPTNAAAGTLMGGAKSLYISTRTASTSFVVATANATSAAGTETFDYIIINP